MKLAAYLDQQKRLTGMTLTDLARRANVRVSYLHDIKTGRRRPSLAVAVKIEKATLGNVRPHEMLAERT